MARRLSIPERLNWREKVEQLGFPYHTSELEDGTLDRYWTDAGYYRFSLREINRIEAAAQKLHEMCMDALGNVLTARPHLLERLGYSREFLARAKADWDNDAPGLSGRFDFALRRGSIQDGNPAQFFPVMLEYNAETPTSLLEAAVVQWQWLQDSFPQDDQFNSIHEQLVETWKYFKAETGEANPTVHFAFSELSVEDEGNVRYLADTAKQGGFEPVLLAMSDLSLGELENGQTVFCDPSGQPIGRLFKLYPWEWMHREDFFADFLKSPLTIFEPTWRALLASKALLPVLSELFPDSPYLLKAWFTEEEAQRSGLPYVQKPILGREGAGVSFYNAGGQMVHDGSRDTLERPDVGFIYQEQAQLLEGVQDDGTPMYAVMGAWVIGETACGMGIREDQSTVTGNLSRFVPHMFANDKS